MRKHLSTVLLCCAIACGAAWAGSYVRAMRLDLSAGWSFFGITMVRGMVYVEMPFIGYAISMNTEFVWAGDPALTNRFNVGKSLAGFVGGRLPAGYYFVGFPLWFPTIAMLLAYLVLKYRLRVVR